MSAGYSLLGSAGVPNLILTTVTVQVATKTHRINMSFSRLSEKEEGIARKIVD